MWPACPDHPAPVQSINQSINQSQPNYQFQPIPEKCGKQLCYSCHQSGQPVLTIHLPTTAPWWRALGSRILLLSGEFFASCCFDLQCWFFGFCKVWVWDGSPCHWSCQLSWRGVVWGTWHSCWQSQWLLDDFYDYGDDWDQETDMTTIRLWKYTWHALTIVKIRMLLLIISIVDC